MSQYVEIKEFIGLTFKDVKFSDDEIEFTTTEGVEYRMYHLQDCCESVYIESFTGDINDLINSPILFAEESSNSDVKEQYESSTWTFYKLATVKGWVDIRWFGSSNGYYSESVSIIKK